MVGTIKGLLILDKAAPRSPQRGVGILQPLWHLKRTITHPLAHVHLGPGSESLGAIRLQPRMRLPNHHSFFLGLWIFFSFVRQNGGRDSARFPEHITQKEDMGSAEMALIFLEFFLYL
jgi:hypothetical protein